VRVRDHIALSTAGAAALSPWLGRRALHSWAASIAIDVDHYVWFCVRRNRWSPVAAARLFNEPEPPNHAATRFLHGPLALVTIALLGVRRKGARAAALGMAMHVGLDAYHERRMNRTRILALHRDDYTCRMCGARGIHIGTHMWQQPRLLPSYGLENHIALCSTCHETAHAGVCDFDSGRRDLLFPEA
jgi:hypothetical protein